MVEKEYPCCPSHSLPKLSFDGPCKGVLSKIGELDVYTVGDAPKVFIFIYDIYGLNGGRTRQVCDQIASLGYTVVLPDVLRGDPWKESVPMGPELFKWLSEIDYQGIEDYLLKTLIPHLKSMGKSGFAIGGTCFGAWVGLKALAKSSDLSCGISYHPSYKIEELQGRRIQDIALAVKQPHLLLPAQNDPDSVKNGGEIVKILEGTTGNRVEVVEMNDVPHGFLVRGDLNDGTLLKRVEQSLCLTKEFLGKYL